MNITINAVNFSPTEKLEKFVDSKVKKLGQFSDAIIAAEVFLKAERTQSGSHKIKKIKIKLEIPGSELFAEKQSETFEEATDHAVDALKRQLTKKKEKIRNK